MFQRDQRKSNWNAIKTKSQNKHGNPLYRSGPQTLRSEQSSVDLSSTQSSPQSLSFSSWTVLESLPVCVCCGPQYCLIVFKMFSGCIMVMWMSVWAAGAGSVRPRTSETTSSEQSTLQGPRPWGARGRAETQVSPDILSLTIRYVKCSWTIQTHGTV